MNHICTILGRRQQGKSTLAVALAQRWNRHIVIYAPSSNDPYGNMPSGDLEDLENWLENPGKFFVYRVPPGVDDNEAFDEFSAAIREYESFCLVIDEAHRLQSPHKMNASLALWVREAPTISPRKVNIIQTAHEPHDTFRLVRSLNTELALFRMTLKRDLVLVAEWTGDEIAAIVADLSHRHFLLFHIDSGTYRIYQDPDLWNVPLEEPGLTPATQEGAA